MLGAIGHAAIATDLSGTVVYWNRAAETLYGWSASEAVGRDVVQLTAPAASAEVASIVDSVRNGEKWSGEFLARRADGTQFYAQVDNSPIRDAEGNLVGVIGMSFDVTERRRVRDHIQDIAWFPEENPNPVLRVSDVGVLLYANPASRDLLQTWNCGVGDPVPEECRRTVADVRASGRPRHIDWTIGSTAYLALVVPVTGAPYLNLYLRDITDNRRTEHALRESEERLRLIADNVLDLFSQVSLDGTFQYVSPSHHLTLGYAPAALLGTSAYVLVHPDDLTRVRADLQGAIASHATERFEVRCRHADGHYLHLEVAGKLLVDASGAAAGAVLSGRDITEQRRLQDALRQRTDELERFNRLAVGRELRMMDLKQEINALCGELGRSPRYVVHSPEILRDAAGAERTT